MKITNCFWEMFKHAKSFSVLLDQYYNTDVTVDGFFAFICVCYLDSFVLKLIFFTFYVTKQGFFFTF